MSRQEPRLELFPTMKRDARSGLRILGKCVRKLRGPTVPAFGLGFGPVQLAPRSTRAQFWAAGWAEAGPYWKAGFRGSRALAADAWSRDKNSVRFLWPAGGKTFGSLRPRFRRLPRPVLLEGGSRPPNFWRSGSAPPAFNSRSFTDGNGPRPSRLLTTQKTKRRLLLPSSRKARTAFESC